MSESNRSEDRWIDIALTDRADLGCLMLMIANYLKEDPVDFLTCGELIPERPLWDENGIWVGDGVGVVRPQQSVYEWAHENLSKLCGHIRRAKELCVLLPDDATVMEAHSVLIIAELHAWNAWLFTNKDQAELGIDDAEALEILREDENLLGPISIMTAECLGLCQRLGAKLAAEAEREEYANTPADHDAPGFLDLVVDTEQRTASREGFKIAPISLTARQWEAFLLLYKARGDEVPLGSFEPPAYKGSTKGAALRNVHNDLGTKLFPFDVGVVDWALKDCRKT